MGALKRGALALLFSAVGTLPAMAMRPQPPYPLAYEVLVQRTAFTSDAIAVARVDTVYQRHYNGYAVTYAAVHVESWLKGRTRAKQIEFWVPRGDENAFAGHPSDRLLVALSQTHSPSDRNWSLNVDPGILGYGALLLEPSNEHSIADVRSAIQSQTLGRMAGRADLIVLAHWTAPPSGKPPSMYFRITGRIAGNAPDPVIEVTSADSFDLMGDDTLLLLLRRRPGQLYEVINEGAGAIPVHHGFATRLHMPLRAAMQRILQGVRKARGPEQR